MVAMIRTRSLVLHHQNF